MLVPLTQFQIKTDPIGGCLAPITGFESVSHQPWSEPVRFPIDRRLKIALITSGLISPVLDPAKQIFPGFAAWTRPLEAPVRLKPGARTGSIPFQQSFFDSTPPPNFIQAWYITLSEPVWQKKGLRKELQQFFAYHPRYLPPANVTAIIASTETNADNMEIDVFVYTSPPIPVDLTAVNISITEVPSQSGGNISITESET